MRCCAKFCETPEIELSNRGGGGFLTCSFGVWWYDFNLPFEHLEVHHQLFQPTSNLSQSSSQMSGENAHIHTIIWIAHTGIQRAYKTSVMVKLKLAWQSGNPLWRSPEYWMKGNCPLTSRYTFIPIQWLLYSSKWQAIQPEDLNGHRNR